MQPTLVSSVVGALLLTAAAPSFAGDVKAFVKNGSAIVKGSDSNDVLTIHASGLPPGEIDVAPNDPPATTVNGVAGAVRLTGVTKDLIVALGDGNDELHLNSIALRDFDIALGAGNDALITGVTARSVSVAFGSGIGYLFMNASTIARDLSVSSTESFDQLRVQASSIGDDLRIKVAGGLGGQRKILLASIMVGDSLFVTDAGNGLVTIDDTIVHGDASLRLRPNASVECVAAQFDRDVRVRAPGDASLLFGQTAFRRDFRLATGDGAVEFGLSSSTLDRDLLLTTHGGSLGLGLASCGISGDLRARVATPAVFETMIASAGVAGRFDVRSGAGDERIAATGSAFGGVRLDLGAGRDIVALGAATCSKPASIELGPGDDDLLIDASGLAPAQHSTIPGLFADLGPGDDQVAASEAEITANAKIVLGGGTNTASFLNVPFSGDLRVTAGSGPDSLDLTGSTVGGAKHVDLGGGMNVETP